MKKLSFLSGMATLMAVLALSAGAAFAESPKTVNPIGSKEQTVQINDNGKVYIKGAQVTAINGADLSVKTTWGAATFNWTARTSASTNIMRRYDGKGSLSEIAVGDWLSFRGTLDQSNAGPIVNVSELKDWSLQKAHATFTGSILSLNADAKTFVLSANDKGNITVNLATSATLTKGTTTIAFADLKVADKVTVSGLYDNASKVLTADKVVVKVVAAVIPKTTFEGTVKSVSFGTAMSSFVLTEGDKDYTVLVASDTSVLNTLWLKTALTNLKVGDKVRVYGSMNASANVSATVVRDTSIRI